MYLEKAIEAFIVARKGEGFATATLANNRHHLTVMLRIVGNVPCASIDSADIDNVFVVASERMGADTLNQIQATLQVFFRWCRTRKVVPLDHDPVAGRRTRKVVRRDKPRLSAAEFPQFLNAAENPRDRALMAVGLYLFLRQSEAVDLKIGDLDLPNGYLQVRIFKTNDEDVMPVSSELDAELRSYLTWYASVSPRPLTKTDYLLPARSLINVKRDERGRLIYGEFFTPQPEMKISRSNDIVRRTFTAYGWDLDQRLGMHDLRRSGARALFDELAQSGYDGALRTVQAYLHHASTTMTERYLGLAIDRSNRDKKFRGQPMFPSQQLTGNVVELRRANG